MSDLNDRIQQLLAKVPDPQRAAAASLLAQYGPRLFELAQEDVWQYLRRLMTGDLDVVSELDGKLSNATTQKKKPIKADLEKTRDAQRKAGTEIQKPEGVFPRLEE